MNLFPLTSNNAQVSESVRTILDKSLLGEELSVSKTLVCYLLRKVQKPKLY